MILLDTFNVLEDQGFLPSSLQSNHYYTEDTDQDI